MNGKVKIDKARGEALARRTWETEFLTCLYRRSTRHVKKHQLFFTPNSLYTQIVLRWMPTPRETWTGSVPYVGQLLGESHNVDVKRIALTVTAMIPARGCQRLLPPKSRHTYWAIDPTAQIAGWAPSRHLQRLHHARSGDRYTKGFHGSKPGNNFDDSGK